MTRISEAELERNEAVTEIDLRGIGSGLYRRRVTIATVALVALVAMIVLVNAVTPVYTATAQILLENEETFFTRPDRTSVAPDTIVQFDPEGVASQVQLIESRDIARRAIKQLDLEGNPEFDPEARNTSALNHVLVLIGLARDPTRESVDQRIVTTFLSKLSVFSPLKTRVISIEFSSRDPELAARGANAIATLYISEQSAAKRLTAKGSADSLASQIADLRIKLNAADAERERYRLESGLLAGSNNMTISGQQLADVNTDLSRARTAQADAQAKASMIRELLRQGKAADVSDVINNEMVRHVSDQRVNTQAQLALESRTLLPGHPRIKALTAQLQEYDTALKAAAKQAEIALENEAKIAGTRVVNLETVLTQQKKVAGVANVDEVHLHALELASQSYKDQLESSAAKYQEALARQSSTATPADARIISRAVQPQEPSYPKKLSIIGFGTTAALVFTIGIIVAKELLSGVPGPQTEPTPIMSREVTSYPEPDEAPRITPRRAPLEATSAATAKEENDLVFAPVDRLAARDAAVQTKSDTDGLLGSLRRRVNAFGVSAAASRGKADATIASRNEPFESPADKSPTDKESLVASAQAAAAAASDDRLGTLTNRIVGAHVPGRGLHVVGTSLGPEQITTTTLIELSRNLAQKGRAIIVDLNRSPAKLSMLAKAGGDGRAQIMGMDGLSELLSGAASFAEVIYRDHGSRLHFIPSGRHEADFRDFDLILDALSETYDFIVMLTPTFPQSEIAKIMAPYADFVVLSAEGEPDAHMLSILETELLEAGARAVLVAGLPPKPSRDGQIVA